MPNRIQQRRLELEMTQAELAKRLKISVTYLSKLENERVNINVKLAIRIARALRARVEDIFFD
ncbi:helix-turn-helix domain-containing protein [Neobacillus drentensis]|uniref:helix-turn-helix transcriptional regulator n=1 Tax=Neobacillus drentensis TaxID=220684 RepID=UPI001F265896|nr:helix-turn-helix domain-containing protein [Neobacillus drentensis]ULT55439.1 helix-turn-helix domain-containing protein [Neobacillus drentensis]